PEKGKIAGIDFGTVRIGIATCDPERLIAFPYAIYRRRNEKKDIEYFQQFAKEERIVHFVLGLPLHCNGDLSDKAREAIAFGAQLAEVTGLTIDFLDERFTSAEAENYLRMANLNAKKRKERLDMVAAQIILSTYLERGCVGTTEFLALDDEEKTQD
ncbi:MAG: Holliday junction resolvase RuvX, partial [Thermoguttaceae bacterium]|nr:Holliday junction resolvase RuvX [Thermoguttaceae bacterium]